MKKILILIVIAYWAWGYVQENPDLISTFVEGGVQGSSEVQEAYRNQLSGVQVLGSGKVNRILSDDNSGSRHQRIIVRLSSGQTVLIAHNIDLALRISTLKKNDDLQFYGEYEWNPKGGVIHWTHHDPAGRHVGGWLKHNGQKYY